MLNKTLRVTVVPYNPVWPSIFTQEAERLKNTLGSLIREIHHIGSTAIPNMSAKPVIDIILECDNLDDIELIKEKLSILNYHNVRRQIIPFQSYFVKRYDQDIAFHLHLHEVGSPQIKRHVNFRDYLIQHPQDAKEYAELKLNLATEHSENIARYVKGKDRWVQAIDMKAKKWEGRKKDYHAPNPGPAAKYLSDQKLTMAMIANLNVHMTHFAQYLNQIELIRISGYTIVNSGLPDDTFNYVIDADFSEQDAVLKIKEIKDYFLPKKIPFSWWVSPYDRPNNLNVYLKTQGFENTENNTAMYLNLDTWDAPSFSVPTLKIVRAKDEKTLHDFALVLVNDKTSFETYFSWIATVLDSDDPIEYYVGYVNGKPVVRGLSCYFAQVVGLHWLSTAVDERKKGYATAMQQFRLLCAKERGYHIAVLQASHEGYPLYQRLGYKDCGVFSEFKCPL